MRSALRRTAPPLVIDLRSGDVAMAEQVLNFPNVHADIQQQCRVGGAKRMRRVDAVSHDRAVFQRDLLDGSGQLLQIGLNQPIHRGRVHPAVG
jgi:hypothetical protein